MNFAPPTIDWAALTPVLIVLGAGLLGVLVAAFVPRPARRGAQVVLTALALAGALVAVVWRWTVVSVNGPAEIVGGSLIEDGPALLAQGIIALVALVGLLVIADRSEWGEDAFAAQAATRPGSPDEDEAQRAGLSQTEVFPFVLFSVGGMLLFPAAGDLVMMFIALEVLSLPLYLLSGMARRRRLLSQEAALKYFVLGAFSSAFFVMGAALLYGFSGSLRLSELAVAVPSTVGMDGLLLAGSVLVIIGLLFKVGAVPFHLWIPDAYQGATIPVAAFLSVVSKGGAVAALVVVLAHPLVPLQPRWDLFVAIVAALSMTVGNIGALAQRDVVGMLAWSAVAQGGFVLAPMVALAVRADVVLTAPLRYLAVYAMATLTVFAVAAVAARRFGGTSYAHLAGVGRRDPVLGVALVLGLLTLAGFPPAVIGLVAKYLVLQPVVVSGYAWLAGIMAVNVALGLVYYLRLVVVAYAPAARVTAGDGAPVTSVREGRGARLAYAVVVVGAVALAATSIAPSLLLGALP